MPKKNEKSGEKQQQPAYPVQPPLQQPVLYPTQQPMYNPMMQAQPPYNPAMQGPYSQGMPAPPPSYEQSLNHPVAPNNYVPNQQWAPPGQMPAGAPYYGAPQQQPVMYNQSPYQQQQQVQVQPIQGPATFVVPGGFDAGARFNSTSQARIPPPPPGIAPNVAQVAAASGHNVVIGQRPDNYLTGGSSGGMTFCERIIMESRKFLPSLYVRGTFYQVGYDVGETFKCMIEDYVQLSSYLSNQLLPAYNTRRGQLIYRDTLNLMKTKFPHYVRELQGIADGSQVPFHQLMLLHMDTMILAEGSHNQEHSGNGCSSIMCNQQDVILGHTEDALPPANHHCYVIHADITDSEAGVLRHEKFSALCYAGHLPGFCMNINTHGFVYSINVIEALRVHPDKTPRHFLTRALLTARNLEEAQLILRDSGCGSSHGFCVNMAFIHQEGPILFHSAEVGPAANGESQLSILTVSPGESHARYNKYLRLNIEEEEGCCVHSSNGRQRAVDRLGLPQTVNDVMDLLSNQDDPDYPIYRSGASKKDIAVTIATGIFDFRQKEWRLYVDRANSTPPIAVFPMEI